MLQFSGGSISVDAASPRNNENVVIPDPTTNASGIIREISPEIFPVDAETVIEVPADIGCPNRSSIVNVNGPADPPFATVKELDPLFVNRGEPVQRNKSESITFCPSLPIVLAYILEKPRVEG